MLRDKTTTTLPEDAPQPRQQTHDELMEERLDLIVQYLHRADRRDKWRTIGGFMRTVITLIPMLFFLGSLWFVYTNGDVLLKKLADQAAQSAAQYSQQSTQNLIDRVTPYIPGFNHSSASSSRR